MLKTSISAFAGTLLALPLGASHAQDGPFSVIPVDRNAPEVVELDDIESTMNLRDFARENDSFDTLRADSVVRDAAEELQRSESAVILGLQRMRSADQRDRRFFAVIDVPMVAREALEEANAEPALKELAPDIPELDRDLLRVSDNTTYSPPEQGWFSTNYPVVNANLRCDWIYNVELEQVFRDADRKAKETELESSYRQSTIERDSPNQSLIPLDPGRTDVEEVEGDEGIERQFLIAGRPCTLTYMCGGADVPCSQIVADRLVENVVLISVGED